MSETWQMGSSPAASRGPLPPTDLSARGVGHMVRRNLTVFLQTWKVNFLPPLIEPFLYLVALGYGLGLLVGEVQGMPYRQFIAPAIITITMMQSAYFETTYSSFVRMVFQRTWDQLVATPLSHHDILVGEVAWAALRATINSTIMSLVVAGFGLLSWPTALLIPLVSLLVGLTFGGLGLWMTGKVPSIDFFGYAMYLVITPMFLFSGTFFPLEQLPLAGRVVAYLFPLTHGVNLVRGLAIGTMSDWWYWSALYLLASSVVAPWLGVRACVRRVVS